MSVLPDENLELAPSRIPASIEPHAEDADTSNDEQSLKHLTPRAASLAKLGSKKRIRAVRSDMVVKHPAIVEILTYARWLLDGPPRTRTTGLLVTGEVGAGKTTLAHIVQRSFTKTKANDAPIIMISLTGARHMRTVYGRILEALNGPVYTSHRTSDREMTVTRILKTVRCRALIVDEVQDVLAGSLVEQRRVLDGIKFLMNELRLPIVALGVPAAAEAFRSDLHLDARFKRFELPTWEANAALASFLFNIERLLPLQNPSQLHSQSVMDFLVRHAGNTLDGIMSLIRSAAVHAILSGVEQIDEAMLRKGLDTPDVEGAYANH